MEKHLLSNVDSITNYAASTKKDDATKIGKFGIGFKAVFLYTKSPTIFCAKSYCFEINETVIPEKTKKPNDRDKGITRFVFPFNHPLKSTKQSFDEISSVLENVSEKYYFIFKIY